MSEWWTYGPRDLLMFSADTYYRLFELYNRDMWPLQLVMLTLGGIVALLVWRGGKHATRVAFALLALGWLWVAWAYLWQRLADIHLAGGHFAAAFVLQAVLLALAGLGSHAPAAPGSVLRRRVGLGVLLFAVAGLPLLAPLSGRGWPQAEVLAMAPDPMVLATLGVLLAQTRAAWWLYPLPLAWCVVSGATLWAMDAPDFAVLPLAATLVFGIAAVSARH